MSMVSRQSGESVERLISRFRRKVIKRGVMKQVREGQYYRKKPSRRVQKLRAIYREKKRKELERGEMTS